MADPVLDEDYIIHLLQAPAQHGTLPALQGGAVQAMCDLYDRKVTREEFVRQAAICIGLYGQCSKLWMLENIRDVFDGGELSERTFEAATEGLEHLIRTQSELVIEMVKRLQMCPTSKDPVN